MHLSMLSPRVGGAGRPRGIWHFHGSQSQIPHPQAPNECQIPAPPGARKGLIKGEALRLLRTNSSAKSFYCNITNFKMWHSARGYPHNLIEKIISEVKFTERKSALQQEKVRNRILPFVTTYHPALLNLKNISTSKWHLIQNQPLLWEILKERLHLSRTKKEIL